MFNRKSTFSLNRRPHRIDISTVPSAILSSSPLARCKRRGSFSFLDDNNLLVEGLITPIRNQHFIID